MVSTVAQIHLLDVVALREALPDHHLYPGQVGTVVEVLAPEVYEVDFSDDEGQTYAMLPLHASQLLKLHYIPNDLARDNPEDATLTMSNQINQYGQGDNIAGDKIGGDKVIGNKQQTQFTNHLQGANIANFANTMEGNATQSAENFSQTSGTSTAELLQLVAALRQSVAQFPPAVQEDLIIDLEDVEAEIQKPEAERKPSKLKKRLTALIAAASVVAAGVAGANEFVDNVQALGEKLGIELPLLAGDSAAQN